MPRPYRTARDASDPKPGEVYETRWGNRWAVTGRSKKGHVLVKRAGNRYDGELQWTPAMLARLKQVRGAEAKAVAAAVEPLVENKEKPVAQGFLGGFLAPDPSRPKRRFYVYVIEEIRRGKREFYVGQTGKTPDQRFKEHKQGHFSYLHGGKAVALRKDLTKRVNPLYTRDDAEKAERLIARTLRKRGLRVKGGH